ncbi:MAG TPA: NAD-dependent epimerase/dehydratase family protein [Solirubrobacteraceae bacterium]
MKVLVIGGTGHIGTYLVPRLVRAGHEVTVITRGVREPYRSDPAWGSVRTIVADREAEDADGTFASRVAQLEAQVVVDLICFAPESAQMLIDALHGRIEHFLHCGTIWVHGSTTRPPTTEQEPRRPFGEYGIRKAAIEDLLLSAARRFGFVATVLHPGQIVGPGWVPVNPAGNFNTEVFHSLARGEEVVLPNLGMETLHHVHADDVAQGFAQAIANRGASLGESFHVVSQTAITLRGYAKLLATWFGQPAQLRFQPWESWKADASEEDSTATWDHLAHSPCCSIDKARRVLQYEPRYDGFEAVCESLAWMIDRGELAA